MMPGFKDLTSDITRDRSKRGMSWLGFSLALLLFLLPLFSFAQAHLWKYQSFRAFDTGHSGGDHICDLRRDSDGLGRPDRLGDYVTISGSVIAEPSTYETGGRLFWVGQAGCGILVYGGQQSLRLGDSVRVQGWLRLASGSDFLPDTEPAIQGDIAVESAGVRVMGKTGFPIPKTVEARELSRSPEQYGGCLIRTSGLSRIGRRIDRGGDAFVWLHGVTDSVLLYIDADTGCALEPDDQFRIAVTGIIIRMDTPAGIAESPFWCIAPRTSGDIVAEDSGAEVATTSWGKVKAGFTGQD